MMNYNYDDNKVMNGEKALTKKEVFGIIREMLSTDNENDALVAFIDHEVQLLNKERKPSKKALAAKAENEELAKGLALVLTDTPQTGEELADHMGVSKQKVVALISHYLVEGEDYIKEEVKAKTPSGKSTKKTVYKAVPAIA